MRAEPLQVHTGIRHRAMAELSAAPLHLPPGTLEAVGGPEAVARIVDGLYDRIDIASLQQQRRRPGRPAACPTRRRGGPGRQRGGATPLDSAAWLPAPGGCGPPRPDPGRRGTAAPGGGPQPARDTDGE